MYVCDIKEYIRFHCRSSFYFSAHEFDSSSEFGLSVQALQWIAVEILLLNELIDCQGRVYRLLSVVLSVLAVG